MTDKVKFYLDEHVPNAVAEGLQRRGVDVLTVAKAGMRGFNDEKHLQFAQLEKRVLFTQDKDFLRLHASGFSHAGIVYTHQHTASIGEMINGLMLIYEVLESDEMIGKVEFV